MKYDVKDFDFLDFGASGGGSIEFSQKYLGGKSGLGIDLDPHKIKKLVDAGLPCIKGDITNLDLDPDCVRFVTMSHVLEHLDGLATIKQVIQCAARVATDFLFIQGPYYDLDEYLEGLGLKFYYSDWTGHKFHLKTTQLVDVLDDLGLTDYLMIGVGKRDGSASDYFHPLDSPKDQQKYDPKIHPAKPKVEFDRDVYSEMVCLVRLKPMDDWEKIVSTMMEIKSTATVLAKGARTRKQVLVVESEKTEAVQRKLRILFILPTLNLYGGVLSVANLIDELMEMGHDCVLVELSKYAHKSLNLRLEPISLIDWDRIPEVLPPDFDIVVATSWETVKPALGVVERSHHAKPVYFVQGFEVDIIEPEEEEKRAEARATYDQIPTRVVKTEYLRTRLREIGLDAHKIRPGMNLDIFYPRDVERGEKKRIIAMARPYAPNDHRGFGILRNVFSRLLSERDDVEIGFFGEASMPSDVPFPYTDFGRLGPSQLPEAYSWADIYVDASLLHGFGRTGVEAMACGTATIVSDSGGVREYAVDGENALIVPVGDEEATYQAIVRLLDSDEERERLRTNGIKAVQQYADPLAAGEMLEIFLKLVNGS